MRRAYHEQAGVLEKYEELLRRYAAQLCSDAFLANLAGARVAKGGVSGKSDGMCKTGTGREEDGDHARSGTVVTRPSADVDVFTR